ncbi:uncharacterized protein METZ01_LOCUS126535 [marine metagenome]|uniref:Uncharacterized protein n=1 Tax=marine metagenome TaxID=408172 RepID=A0A381YAQ6_9ZZZZ
MRLERADDAMLLGLKVRLTCPVLTVLASKSLHYKSSKLISSSELALDFLVSHLGCNSFGHVSIKPAMNI